MTGIESGAASAGALLKAAREARGLSPEEVAQQLRLSRANVLAMEQDRPEELGPSVFARGHLRKYAQLVGADAEAVVQAHFGSHAETGESSSLLPPASANRPVGGGPRWLRPAMSLAALLLVVAAIAGGGWWAWTRSQSAIGEREGEPPVPAPFQEPTLPAVGVPPVGYDATAEAPAVPGEQPATSEPVTAPSTRTSQPAAPGSGSSPGVSAAAGVSGGLSLGFSGPCWLEVYDSTGRRLAYELAQQGAVRRFGGAGPWRVVLGNAVAARITVNGREVAIPGRLVTNNAASLLVDGQGNVQRTALPLS